MMIDPYQTVALALTYITGHVPEEWKRQQQEWIMDHPIPVPPWMDVWNEFRDRFERDWHDTNEQHKAQAELEKLRLHKDNIDDYINEFARLARKAGFDLDNNAVLQRFQMGLNYSLAKQVVTLDHPNTWDQWTHAVRSRQAEITSLEPLRSPFWNRKEKRTFLGANQRQNHQPPRWRDPNAMQVDALRTTTTTEGKMAKATTKEDAERYKKEGRCFHCGAQGHMKRDCPKRQNSGNPRPMRAAKSEEKEGLTAERVLQYLREVPDEEYQRLNAMWSEGTEEKDFGQA
jgi:hypothetical protein